MGQGRNPSGGQNLGTATAFVELDSSGVTAGMETARGAFERGTQQMSTSLLNVGTRVAALGVSIGTLTKPFTNFIQDGISVAGRFDGAMAEISARTGLFGEELEKIRQAALQMGADTVFSAQESADAFLELLASGQTASEALLTLPDILDAAAASGENLGRTADGVTDIMAAFGIEVKRFEDGSTTAGTVTEALSRAAASSSASVGDLIDGFANVGPAARQYGLSIQDTAAVLAIFSENGIKGAEAGTQLRSMLLNMNRPTDEVRAAWNRLGVSFYDSEGNARKLETVIADLDTALDQLPVEEQNVLMQKLAGSYGILGLSALRSSISIDEMQQRMMDQASVSEIAEKRMNTWEGVTNSLAGSIETLQIEALGPLMDKYLVPLVKVLIDVVNGVTSFAKANPGLAGAILIVVGVLGALAAVLVPLGIAMTAMGTAMGGLSAIMTLFTGSATAASAAAGTAGATTAAAGVAAGTAAGGFSLAGTAATVAAGGVWLLNAALAVLTSPITLLIAAFILLIGVIKRWGRDAWNTIQMIVRLVPHLGEVFKVIIAGIINWIEDLIDRIEDLVESFKRGLDEMNQTGKGRGGLFGSGIGPDFDPLGGLRGLVGLAGGGDVRAGKQYIVGEKGPELFTATTNGTIHSNDTLQNIMNGGKTFVVESGAISMNFGDIGSHQPDQLQSMMETALYNTLRKLNGR